MHRCSTKARAIASLNLTTVSYPGSVRTRFSQRKPQSLSYATFAPVLHYNDLQADLVGGNFWDMRAQNLFNGVNPFGDRDPNAFLYRADAPANPQKVRVLLDNSSLASQAVGPPTNLFEMSADPPALHAASASGASPGPSAGRFRFAARECHDHARSWRVTCS